MANTKDTKENILLTALDLFAKEGYEAVSVSMIAGKLGMTKGALYKHYKNKRDIFDSILKRMSDMDRERAKEHEMPQGTVQETAQAYEDTSLEAINAYSKAQFRYWTEEKFSSDFRKMLTLEQYRSAEMASLYQQYLAGGPLMYMADIFEQMTASRSAAEQTALAFYGPFFLLYSVYDGADNKEAVTRRLDCYVDAFTDRLRKTAPKGQADNEG